MSGSTRLGRLKFFGAPGVTAGLLPLGTSVDLMPGERVWFISILADPLLAGTVVFENTTWTILAGTALTLSGSDFPADCENYYVKRKMQFNSTLGPIAMVYGPPDGSERCSQCRP
jgi:hypothetical protein